MEVESYPAKMTKLRNAHGKGAFKIAGTTHVHSNFVVFFDTPVESPLFSFTSFALWR